MHDWVEVGRMGGLEKVRAAVIGTGAIGRYHIRGFLEHPACEVPLIVDCNESRLMEAAELFRVPETMTDFRGLLERDDIDVVSVALPNDLHAEVTIAMLESGKHVLCEKPMAVNATEAQSMVDTAKRTGKFLMVGQNFRFEADTQRLKQCIEEGALGEIYYARAYWFRRSGIPRIGSWFTRKAEAAGGCLYDIGVHFLDLALHLMGDFEPVSVSGRTFQNFGQRGRGDGTWGMSERDEQRTFDVEDQACAMIHLAGGRSLSLDVSWAVCAEEASRMGVDLYGTEGGAHLFPAKTFAERGEGWVARELDKMDLRHPSERMVHFIDCVLGNAETICPMEESLAVQKILDAIYESSRQGREIRFQP
jgi:predicted dehydrogenase